MADLPDGLVSQTTIWRSFVMISNESIRNSVSAKSVTMTKSQSKIKSANEINIDKTVNTATGKIRPRSECSNRTKQLKHRNVTIGPATHE